MLQTKGVLTYNNKNMGDPCGHYISDEEFLQHMIPHHQVAVDMSKKVLEYSTDPNIVYLARNIIFKQSDEILFMENLLLSYIPNLASDDKQRVEVIPNQFTVWYNKESRAEDQNCGLHHFSSKMAKKHDKGHILTDDMYLKHMIPHHDVAISMSERVTTHSKNPALVSFAYEIIKNQRYEIWLMRTYLKDGQVQCSEVFLGKQFGVISDLNNDESIIEGFSSAISNGDSYVIFSSLFCVVFIMIFITRSYFNYKLRIISM